jgi:hypothetical protein
MAVLQRVALYPNERYDTPDARAMEAFAQNDWRFFLSGVFSQKSYIVSGFEITNYNNIFIVPGVRLKQNNAVIMHPEASTQAAGFYVAAGSEPDAQLQLSPNSTNFVEIDFTVSSGTPDTRAFWDMGADGGAGAEFTDDVDTVINLELKITSNVSGFTEGKIPLYKIVTSQTGVANEVTDCRPLFFRLGTGGSTPNPDAQFAWPQNSPDPDHAQWETPIKSVTSNTSNAPFQGGDKNIKSLKDWMDAVMTNLMRLKASPYWYSPTMSMGEVYQNSSMTVMVGGTWRHEDGIPGRLTLSGGSTLYRIGKQNNCSLGPFSELEMASNPVLFIILPDDDSVSFRMGQDNSLPVVPKIVTASSNNEITVSGRGNYILSGGNLMVRGKKFSYQSAAYNSASDRTVFSVVTPDPSGIVKSGDFVYQADYSVNGYYHYSQSQAVPGINSSGVSEGVERTMWIGFFDGSYVHTPDSKLEKGEQVQIGQNSSQSIFDYIGSNGEADSNPVYSVNSITDGIDLTSAITEAFKILEKPIYDETILDIDGNGWPAGNIFTLPLNTRAQPMTAAVFSVTADEVSITSSGNFKETNSAFTSGNISYSYTSYSKVTKTFTGVSPSPVGTLSPEDIISQMNTYGQYTQLTGELQVYENGVLWRPSKTEFGNDGDYQEISNNTIKTLRDVPAGSTVRFRIASVGGAGAASSNSLTGVTLQRAYSNGRTIVVQPTAPIEITGPGNGEIPFVVHDSIQVDNNVLLSGLEQTPVGTNPIPSSSVGLWVDDVTSRLQYTRPNGTVLHVGDILELLSGDYSQLTRTMQNGTLATIPAGAPVYIMAQGQVAMAHCDSDVSYRFLGIAATSIPPEGTGKIIYAGVVPGIFNGMGLNSGYIWLGSSPGQLSLVEPENAGDYLVIIGLIDGEHLILQPQLNGQL